MRSCQGSVEVDPIIWMRRGGWTKVSASRSSLCQGSAREVVENRRPVRRRHRVNHRQDREEERVTTGGFSPKRLGRVREVLERYVDSGFVPGAVAVVARHGEVRIEATGTLAFEGEGSGTPMAADTICRIGSMTKPIVAVCAMTLVEDCSLRLDDPVDEFLPELADMTVLADPDGPLEETVPAQRPITLRDLLTFTFGTGIVVAEPGTIPIADALNELHQEPGP